MVIAPSISTGTFGVAPQDAGVACAIVTVGQQLGASIGTSLLTTIFAGAVTSYVAAHLAAARIIGRPALTGLALAHGYDTASWWTAGIFAAGAVIGGALLPTGPWPGRPTVPRPGASAHRPSQDRKRRSIMRAAVVRRSGAAPALDQFADPQPCQGVAVATLVAAALNPLDIAIVNDQIPFRRLEPPYIAGYEAVVQLGDGTRCYLGGPPAPYGALAELVPVPDSAGFPVPAGLDPGLAAALGVAGLAGWVALDYHGHLQPGETVLVLGAGGAAGQLAVQSAQILGAGRVVGAARGQAADRGADAVVDLAYDQAIDAGLAAAAPGGYDVIVDFLWGVPAPYAMNHANLGARYIQVGSSAGPMSTISAPVVRNKVLTLVGQGMAAAPAEIRRAAYAHMVRHAADGQITLDLEQTRLADIGQTWEHLKTGPSRKLVVTP